ncbi:MAG: hypothetical protein ACXV3F_16340 [Frankiaceae bacterium]
MVQTVVAARQPSVHPAETVIPRRRRRRLPGGWSLLIYLVGSALLYHRSLLPNR